MAAGLEQTPELVFQLQPSAPRRRGFLFKGSPVRAELTRAPTDNLGIPLPIIPSENLTRYKKGSQVHSKHHEFFLYGPETYRTLGGQAMRASRMLRVENEVHNNGRHALHGQYDFSPGPNDEQGQFDVCVLSLANYIPDQGIDLWTRWHRWPRKPRIRPLEPEERDILTYIHPNNPDRYHNFVNDRGIILPFLGDFVLKQELSAVSPEVLEDFTSTTRLKPTMESGNEILAAAIRSATASVGPSYQAIRELGLLHPRAPFSPEALMLNAFGDETRRLRILHSLKHKLIPRLAASSTLQRDLNPIESVA